MHRLAITMLSLSIGCAAAPDTDDTPLAPEHTTQSMPAVDSELVGLCVNAAYAEQRPEASAWCDLAPTWIRSLITKESYVDTLKLLAAYRTRGEKNPKVLALFNQESVDVPAPESPFFAGGSCDFTRPTSAEYDAAVASYGAAWGDKVSALMGNYGDAFDAVELFNEPDGIAGGCLRPQDFATILAAAIPRIEPMLLGRPYTIGSMIHDWRPYMIEVVDRLYDAGIDFDGFSFHPYTHYVVDAKGECPSAWKDQRRRSRVGHCERRPRLRVWDRQPSSTSRRQQARVVDHRVRVPVAGRGARVLAGRLHHACLPLDERPPRPRRSSHRGARLLLRVGRPHARRAR